MPGRLRAARHRCVSGSATFPRACPVRHAEAGRQRGKPRPRSGRFPARARLGAAQPGTSGERAADGGSACLTGFAVPVCQPGTVAAAADDDRTRRSVVPERAGRSPWLAALWTGFGAAVVCALIAIVLVAICWLPVSGDAGATNGRTTSAIRAGLLTFLAALHGGLTVNGVSVDWLPLGMALLVGLVARRAGHGLADAAHALGERDPLRLTLVAAAQTVTFAIAALVAIPFATLGTSRAPFLGVALGALLVFGLFGGTAFVRATPLREVVAARISPDARAALHAAAAAIGVYLIAGTVLVAGSLVVHHDTVAKLMSAVGGGWGAVPVLLLCVLAVPNAAIAGAAYLLGPGFAVGTGTHAGLFGSTHGVVPAF